MRQEIEAQRQWLTTRLKSAAPQALWSLTELLRAVSTGGRWLWGGIPNGGGEPAAADVVELIKNDHREVERLFDLLKKQPATRGLNFPVAVCPAHCALPGRGGRGLPGCQGRGWGEGRSRTQPGRARRG